uniref:G-protein coupled receptors family 1 profile domain-containing protein n=1 Tax=Acrobeloides nanus TaxID=290746 RepID=A0A914E0T6_9BILA
MDGEIVGHMHIGENITTSEECYYIGTDYLHIKIYLIGVFATIVAIVSFSLNSFYTIVFLLNPALRRTTLYYFGILAVLDIIMAVNYFALMVVPHTFLMPVYK